MNGGTGQTARDVLRSLGKGCTAQAGCGLASAPQKQRTYNKRKNSKGKDKITKLYPSSAVKTIFKDEKELLRCSTSLNFNDSHDDLDMYLSNGGGR